MTQSSKPAGPEEILQALNERMTDLEQQQAALHAQVQAALATLATGPQLADTTALQGEMQAALKQVSKVLATPPATPDLTLLEQRLDAALAHQEKLVQTLVAQTANRVNEVEARGQRAVAALSLIAKGGRS